MSTLQQELEQQIADQRQEIEQLKDQRDMLLLLSLSEGEDYPEVLKAVRALFPEFEASEFDSVHARPELLHRLYILLGKKGASVQPSELENHIEQLCQKHNILEFYTVSSPESAYAVVGTRTVHLAKITNLTSYVTALHEIAHCVLDHRPKDWDEEAQCEIDAWEWAYQKSLMRVPMQLKMQFEKQRIKGSWETR